MCPGDGLSIFAKWGYDGRKMGIIYIYVYVYVYIYMYIYIIIYIQYIYISYLCVCDIKHRGNRIFFGDGMYLYKCVAKLLITQFTGY